MTPGYAPHLPAQFSFLSSSHPFSWADPPCDSPLCLGRSLLAYCDRAAPWSLARPRISVRALAPRRQTAPMPQPAIGADFHEPFDVERDFLPEIAFDSMLLFDDLADLVYFVVVEFTNLRIRTDTRCAQNLIGLRTPDSVDVGESDLD